MVADRGRLAYVIDELEVGGTQRQLLEMATGLARRGWHTRVVCLQPVLTMAEEFREAGIPVDLIPKRRTMDLALVTMLARTLRQDRIGLVHAFSATAEFFGALAARLVNARFVASIRAYDERLPPLVRLGKRFACRLADVVVANSTAGAERAVARGIVSPSKVRVIRNGIRWRPSARGAGAGLRRAVLDGPDGFVILSVGRLVRVKRYDLAIAITARLASARPGVRLLIAGEGPVRGELERQIDEHRLETVVRLLGERRDVPNVLAAADVYLVTSCSEGLSNSIMEAMTAGLPVVASAVGGNPELVVDGKTGFLYPAGEVTLAAERLSQLAAADELRTRLGASGRERIVTEFGIEQLLSRLERLYAELG